MKSHLFIGAILCLANEAFASPGKTKRPSQTNAGGSFLVPFPGNFVQPGHHSIPRPLPSSMLFPLVQPPPIFYLPAGSQLQLPPPPTHDSRTSRAVAVSSHPQNQGGSNGGWSNNQVSLNTSYNRPPMRYPSNTGTKSSYCRHSKTSSEAVQPAQLPTAKIVNMNSQPKLVLTGCQHFNLFQLKQCDESDEGGMVHFMVDLRQKLIGNDLDGESKRLALIVPPPKIRGKLLTTQFDDLGKSGTKNGRAYLVLLERKSGKSLFPIKTNLFEVAKVVAFCEMKYNGIRAGLTHHQKRKMSNNNLSKTKSELSNKEAVSGKTIDVSNVSDRECTIERPAVTMAKTITFKTESGKTESELNPFLKNDESILLECFQQYCNFYEREPGEKDRKITFKMLEKFLVTEPEGLSVTELTRE